MSCEHLLSGLFIILNTQQKEAPKINMPNENNYQEGTTQTIIILKANKKHGMPQEKVNSTKP